MKMLLITCPYFFLLTILQKDSITDVRQAPLYASELAREKVRWTPSHLSISAILRRKNLNLYQIKLQCRLKATKSVTTNLKYYSDVVNVQTSLIWRHWYVSKDVNQCSAALRNPTLLRGFPWYLGESNTVILSGSSGN